MKRVGERDQEWRYERISRNAKAGKWVELRWKTIGDCVLDPKLGDGTSLGTTHIIMVHPHQRLFHI